MKSKYLITGLLVYILLLIGCQQKESNTINVDGSSEIIVKPNQAEVWAGISIVKSTAQEAQNEANKVINAIIDSLRYKGISEEDIATENVKNHLLKQVAWLETFSNRVVLDVPEDHFLKKVGFSAPKSL